MSLLVTGGTGLVGSAIKRRLEKEDVDIIFADRDKLDLLDQHAVHERIRFEELMKQYSTKRNDTQTLLDPVVTAPDGLVDLPAAYPTKRLFDPVVRLTPASYPRAEFVMPVVALLREPLPQAVLLAPVVQFPKAL